MSKPPPSSGPFATGSVKLAFFQISEPSIDSRRKKQKALDYFGQSLPIFRAIGDRLGEARTLSHPAGV